MSLGAEDLRSVLGSVVHHNAGKWLRFILAILKNDADAEDVIQEAVRRVLSRNLSFQSEDQVRMYLGRAIGNAALELYNRRKRERMRQFPLNAHRLPPADSGCPFFYIEESEKSKRSDSLLRLLDDGLNRLPPKQYEALRLTILESRGLSIREVGETNGIPYSTLRHRSKQGLRRLRRFLERQRRIQESELRNQNSNS